MSKYKIGVVIVNYGGLKDTVECLKSIFNSTPISKKVVVINVSDKERGSKEEGRKIKRLYSEVELIEAENKGYSWANNLGIKWLMENGAETVMLLNNDAIVDRNLLRQMHDSVSENGVGAISPKIYFYKNYEFHGNDYDEQDKGQVIWYAGGLIDWADFYTWHRGVDEVDQGQFDLRQETDFVTGCCVVAKSEIWNRVGLLDEKAFLYYEDVDWSLRVKKAGYKLIYEPRGAVWHKNSGSSSGSGSKTHVYYQTRNRLYYGIRYSNMKTKAILIKDAVSKIKREKGLVASALKDGILSIMGKKSI